MRNKGFDTSLMLSLIDENIFDSESLIKIY
jgi:hypothetical protein|nr:MAG TPA: hypothetical protein [Caudoviricetes sp.]